MTVMAPRPANRLLFEEGYLQEMRMSGLKQRAKHCQACALGSLSAQAAKVVRVGKGCVTRPRVAFVVAEWDSSTESLLQQWVREDLEISWEEVLIVTLTCCESTLVATSVEYAACRPFVQEQLEITAPDMIVVCGLTAAKTLLSVEQGLDSLRKEWFWFRRKTPLRVTYELERARRLPAVADQLRLDLAVIKPRLHTRRPQSDRRVNDGATW